MNPGYVEIATGLDKLIAEVRSYAGNAPRKLGAMQDVYFKRHPSNHSSEEIELLRTQMQAFNYKWLLSTLSLEQLWALSHRRRMELVDSALDIGSVADPLEQDDLLLVSFAYEGFLLQARSFLDYYMQYLCIFFGHADDIKHINVKKFYKCMNRRNGRFDEKQQQVKQFISTQVLAEDADRGKRHPEKWGDLLKALRDKVTHVKPLRYTYESSEYLHGGLRFDWPTVRGETYDRSAQSISNGMFEMVQDLAQVLYELPWQPGPYKPSLWQGLN